MATNNDPLNFPSHFITSSPSRARYYFVLEIERALSAIRVSKHQFISARLTKDDVGFITPIDCDYVADVMVNIVEVSSKMIGTVRSLSKIQELTRTNRYEVLMCLYSAGDAARKSNKLIKEFRSICMDNSDNNQKRLLKIQEVISILKRECEQIEKTTEEFLDSMVG